MIDRAKIVRDVMAKNSLPEHLAEKVVDAAGAVDSGKLDIVKASIAWGQTPASKASPELIDGLVEALRKATARKDGQAVISLRSALAKLGVLNPKL